jgi:hypothetical protein
MTSRRALLIVLALAGCNPAPAPVDAGGLMDDGSVDASMRDAAPTDDADTHMGLRLPRCEDTDPSPAVPLPHVMSTLDGRLVPGAERLASAMSLNPASERGEMMYRTLDFHVVEPGPGQTHLLRSDLGATTTATTGRTSLAWLGHYSDFQLVDDESPTRLTGTDNPAIPGGMRSQEAYLPRAVSAMSRTFGRIEDASRPFDFGIITGDCADSAQENELRWVIALMNGEPGLETDSGDDDDPVPGAANDPKDPFDPSAFPAPWFYVPGNHDTQVVGITTPNDDLRATAIGSTTSTGTRDYRQWYAPSFRGDVPADPDRRILERDDIVSILREATSGGDEGPPGHGYPTTGAVDTSLGANWTFDVIPGLLRVLALDSSDRTGGSSGMVMQATVDGWLIPELDRAVSDGVLVLLASHHSTRSINPFEGELGSTPVPGALTGDELEAIVAARPEVIAWLVGHTHDNRIRAVEGADAAHPGYWEIMTSAIADFPSQARTIELVNNGDGTLSIFATLIDYDTDDCFERRYRALTQMEWLSHWSDEVSHDPADENVELVRAIPPSALVAVETASATASGRIESLTTLAGE